MKVLIDHGNAPPKTGIGIFGVTLQKMLQLYYGNEIEVHDSGTSLVGYHLRPARRLIYLWNLYALRKQDFNGADVIHFINQYVPRRHHRVKYVTTIHDLDPIKAPEAHTRRYSAYFSFVLKQAIANAHLIETPSEFVRQELLEAFTISPDRVRVAGNGPSHEFIERALSHEKRSPQVPILLYVGLISKKKNVAWLVRSVTKGVQRGALPQL
ncbi:MAG TPA: glycosyltransferase, partial [Nitrososphaera sp.]|nr:glycosyltransferase [Nitrososphaera sp.]